MRKTDGLFCCTSYSMAIYWLRACGFRFQDYQKASVVPLSKTINPPLLSSVLVIKKSWESPGFMWSGRALAASSMSSRSERNGVSRQDNWESLLEIHQAIQKKRLPNADSLQRIGPVDLMLRDLGLNAKSIVETTCLDSWFPSNHLPLTAACTIIGGLHHNCSYRRQTLTHFCSSLEGKPDSLELLRQMMTASQ